MNLFLYCNSNPVMGYNPSGHWTISFNLSLNAHFIVGASISISFSYDSNGENAILWSYSHPFDENTPDIGFVDLGVIFSAQYTNLASVDNLDEDLSYYGGSIGSGFGITGDVISNVPVSQSGGEIIGGQLGAGISLGAGPHASQSKTIIIKKNWKGLIGELLEWIFG